MIFNELLNNIYVKSTSFKPLQADIKSTCVLPTSQQSTIFVYFINILSILFKSACKALYLLLMISGRGVYPLTPTKEAMPLWNSEKTVKAKSKHELDFYFLGSLLLSFLKKVAGLRQSPNALLIWITQSSAHIMTIKTYHEQRS